MLRIIIALIGFVLAAPVSAEAVSCELSSMIRKDKVTLEGLSKSRVDALFRGVISDAIGDIECSRSSIDALPAVKGGKHLECLSQARGETVKGQFMVAEVIMNRVACSRYPDSVCGVINQGTGRNFACQFTYTCDGYSEIINEKTAYAQLRNS